MSADRAKPTLVAIYKSRAFKKLLEENKDQLARGAALRRRMQQELAAGIAPTGYRAEFLDRTSREIITHLCAAAERFNAEHPDDLFSSADALDVLATTSRRLLEGAKAFRARSGLENARLRGGK
jgi:hypothetical protein